MNEIPEDIVNYHIIPFLFVQCGKCNKLTHKDEIIPKCRVFLYKCLYSFNFYKIEKYRCLCKECLFNYEEAATIINLVDDKIFKWVIDFKKEIKV